jgi:hypothetical protein
MAASHGHSLSLAALRSSQKVIALPRRQTAAPSATSLLRQRRRGHLGEAALLGTAKPAAIGDRLDQCRNRCRHRLAGRTHGPCRTGIASR